MKPLLLLHGAIGSETQLKPVKDLLSTYTDVYSINFSGHGGNAMQQDLSIEQFAGEVRDFTIKNDLKQVNIFGYSMGGYVALYLAKHHPDLVASIVTLGTKLKWDPAIAAKEVGMLNPEVIEQKVPKFAEQLRLTHQPTDWKMLLQKTGEMLNHMGNENPLKEEDFSSIACKVLLMLGDRDKMVTLDETVSAYKKFSNAQLAVLPGTPHAIEQVDAELVANMVRRIVE